MNWRRSRRLQLLASLVPLVSADCQQSVDHRAQDRAWDVEVEWALLLQLLALLASLLLLLLRGLCGVAGEDYCGVGPLAAPLEIDLSDLHGKSLP